MDTENKYNNNGIVESTMRLSKDGKWFIHKTIITDIKPVNYIKKALGESI
jgi:hypothetical protein